MRFSWYATLRATRLYGLFLEHRVWVARAIRPAGLFFSFPLVSLVIVWLFMPMMFLFLIPVLALAPNIIMAHMAWFSMLYLVFFVATGPFSVASILDFFSGAFSGFANILGRTEHVVNFVRETEMALEGWKAENV